MIEIVKNVGLGMLASTLADPDSQKALVGVTQGVVGKNPRRWFEWIVLKGHHDAVPASVRGKEGYIKLSEWWAGWSVKWYSLDESEQIAFIEGPSVNESKARDYFEKLKSALQDSET